MLRIYLFIFQLSFLGVAFADTCPISPLKIEPELKVEIRFERKTNLYTYSYSMKNKKGALVPISSFRIILNESPLEILNPKKWLGHFYESNKPNDVVFSTSFAIEPRTQTDGFSFKSSRAPGLVRYYARGKTGVPTTTPIPGNDEPTPNCVGFFYDLPFLDGLVNGITEGPAPLDQISVNVKLKKVKIASKDKKEETEDEDFEQISPYTDSEKVAIILKQQKDLDLSTVIISSVTLGTGKAPVIESNLSKEKNHEQLRLVFNLAQLKIECDRDRVLYFSGKTSTGKDLLGAASIKTINCDKAPGQTKQKK